MEKKCGPVFFYLTLGHKLIVTAIELFFYGTDNYLFQDCYLKIKNKYSWNLKKIYCVDLIDRGRGRKLDEIKWEGF